MIHQVLVIGAGSIGERHVRCFLTGGRARVAVCETNPQVRRRITQNYSLVEDYAAIGDVPLDQFDAAVVATPAHLHIPLAIQLVQAKVHVLIEKPLSVSLDQVEELADAARAAGVTAAVAYVYRSNPALVALKTALQQNQFGRPVQVVGTGGQHFPTYRPAYRDTYYRDRATGGGCIQDALTHLLNSAQWLVGPVQKVFADAAHQLLPGVQVEDTAHLLTRHAFPEASSEPATVLGCYSLNQHQPPNELTLQVNCERGAARVEFHKARWRWGAEPGGSWSEESFFPLERDALFIAQAQAFLDAVENRSAPLCTLVEGAQTLRCNLAALQSLETGTWINVNENP